MRRISDTWHDEHWMILAGCLLLCGCGQPSPGLPETFPVTGDVRYPSGDPIAKGLIQLQSESNPSLNVSGTIMDGKFSVTTAFGNTVLPGTMAGRYRVSITPAFEVIPKTFQLPETYEIRRVPTRLEINVRPAQK